MRDSGPLCEGEQVDGRFQIDRLAGRGGMGVVYRAKDCVTGQPVALKVLHREATAGRSAERLAREAELLATLVHPGIVSHVAHGETAEGLRYLAMEWLEGEDLARRLAQGGLSLADTVVCVRAAAAALCVPHRRGVVHRDLKPSNLILRQGQVAQTTLLDFGIAKPAFSAAAHRAESSEPTGSGEAGVGTLLYMAPEQARGEQEVGPSADIFSLGCILYECLTGSPPFKAAHPMAVLARIFCEEALPVRAVRPDVPPALEALLQRMLAKDPQERPRDADALLKELEPLAAFALESGQSAPLPRVGAGHWPAGAELRRVCILLSAPDESAGLRPADVLSPAASLPEERRQAIAAIVRPAAGRVERLLDGSFVITIAGQKTCSALDLANQAARCAQAVTRAGLLHRLALVSCCVASDTLMPPGEVREYAHAASLLRARPRPANSSGPEILLDPLSAELLARSFAIRSEEGAVLLGEPRTGQTDAHSWVSPAPPIFGRESELAALQAAWNTAAEESAPSAVVVSGAAGCGKTRLSQEFLRRVQADAEPLIVLHMHGDPMQTSTPYGLLAQALAELGESAGEVGRLLAQVQTGIPLDHEMVQGNVVRALQVASERARLLLVVDGVQWADGWSLATVGRALRQLAGRPLFVLALGRAEVEGDPVHLWPTFAARALALRGLSQRACERLVHRAAGRRLAPEVMASIAALSGGNPLLLEELVKAVRAGKEARESAPFFAMLQTYLGALPAEARRILLAASVLGLSFSADELRALLGQEGEAELEAGLRTLETAALIERSPPARTAVAVEYRFRHTLIRQAASGLLTARDRELGEQRAAHGRAELTASQASSPSSTSPSSAHRS